MLPTIQKRRVCSRCGNFSGRNNARIGDAGAQAVLRPRRSDSAKYWPFRFWEASFEAVPAAEKSRAAPAMMRIFNRLQ
jgi:hypothetical protein